MFSIKMVPANSNQAKLQRLAKAAPKAAMTALNNTGFVIRPKMKDYVKLKFKNPTPAFYNSILFQKATPQKPDEAYLYVGNRSDAGANKRLSMIAMRQEKGSTASPGDYDRKFWTIPTKDFVGYRNKYGGLRGGTIRKLKTQKKTFVATINGTLGVWRRERKLGKIEKMTNIIGRDAATGRFTSSVGPNVDRKRSARRQDTVKLLIVFKKKASYHPVYKFGVHAAKLAAAEFPRQMRAAMAKLGMGR